MILHTIQNLILGSVLCVFCKCDSVPIENYGMTFIFIHKDSVLPSNSAENSITKLAINFTSKIPLV